MFSFILKSACKFTKSQEQYKKNHSFFFRDGVSSRFHSQSYGKMREERKKSLFFFPIPNESKFGIAKVTEK